MCERNVALSDLTSVVEEKVSWWTDLLGYVSVPVLR